MKKVLITLRPGSTGHKFSLFPSPEAVYVWACALERNEQVVIEGIDEFVLEPNGFIEAELTGFEYIYDSERSLAHKRIDHVRVGLAQHPKNGAGLEVSTHAGWVTGTLLPLRTYSDPHIDVVPLAAKDERLDLPGIFGDELPPVSDDP